MGRKSKLTEQQWSEIVDRNINGESIRSLANEYGIAPNAVQRKISGQSKKIKEVANQIVKAETEFEKLPICVQTKVRTLADSLKATSRHLANASEYGAATASRLSMIANKHTESIDEEQPDIEKLKVVAALAKTANDAAAISINLVKADAVMVAPADDGVEIPTVSEFESISKKLLSQI